MLPPTQAAYQKKSKQERQAQYTKLHRVHITELLCTSAILKLMGVIPLEEKPALPPANEFQDNLIEQLACQSKNVQTRQDKKRLTKLSNPEDHDAKDYMSQNCCTMNEIYRPYRMFLKDKAYNTWSFYTIHALAGYSYYISQVLELCPPAHATALVAAYQERIDQVYRCLANHKQTLEVIQAACATDALCCASYQKWLCAHLKEWVTLPEATQWLCGLAYLKEWKKHRGNQLMLMLNPHKVNFFPPQQSKAKAISPCLERFASELSTIASAIQTTNYLPSEAQDILSSASEKLDLNLGDMGLVAFDAVFDEPKFSIVAHCPIIIKGRENPRLTQLMAKYIKTLHLAGIHSDTLGSPIMSFQEDILDALKPSIPIYSFFPRTSQVLIFYRKWLFHACIQLNKDLSAAHHMAAQQVKAMFEENEKTAQQLLVQEKQHAQKLLQRAQSPTKPQVYLQEEAAAAPAYAPHKINERPAAPDPYKARSRILQNLSYIMGSAHAQGQEQEQNLQKFLHNFPKILNRLEHRLRSSQTIASDQEVELLIEEIFTSCLQKPYPHFKDLTPKEQIESMVLKYENLTQVVMPLIQATLRSTTEITYAEKDEKNPWAFTSFVCLLWEFFSGPA